MKKVTYIQEGLLLGCSAKDAEFIRVKLYPIFMEKVEETSPNRKSHILFLIVAKNNQLNLNDVLEIVKIQQSESVFRTLEETINTLQEHGLNVKKTDKNTLSISELNTEPVNKQ